MNTPKLVRQPVVVVSGARAEEFRNSTGLPKNAFGRDAILEEGFRMREILTIDVASFRAGMAPHSLGEACSRKQTFY